MENINEVLAQVEQSVNESNQSFIIRICNERSGLKEPIPVLPANTLGQILNEAYNLIGTNRDSKQIYFELPSGKSVTDKNLTVAEAGLKADDVLNIVDDGSVA